MLNSVKFEDTPFNYPKLERECFDYLNQAFVKAGASHIQMTARDGGCICSMFEHFMVLRENSWSDVTTDEAWMAQMISYLDESVRLIVQAPVFQQNDNTQAVNIRAFQIAQVFIGSDDYPCPEGLLPTAYMMLCGAIVNSDGTEESFDFNIKFSQTGSELLTDTDDTFNCIAIYSGFTAQDLDLDHNEFHELFTKLSTRKKLRRQEFSSQSGSETQSCPLEENEAYLPMYVARSAASAGGASASRSECHQDKAPCRPLI